MRLSKLVLSTLMCVTLVCGAAPGSAQAGPLLDWLFGRKNTAPAYAVGNPVPMGNGQVAYGYGGYGNYGQYPAGQYGANYGNYYNSRLPVIGGAGAGYLPPAPNGALAPSYPPRTLSYTPAFRTNSYRAPVTYYRPLMTTDPRTGAQVVTQAPCTSYEYQTQRVPILGRREVYGSTLPTRVQPAPQALPTYTIPSGGVPLASNTPVNPGTYRGYQSYSTPYYPGAAAPAQNALSGTYPTNDYRSGYGAYNQGYYGDSYSGGSTGNYAAPNYPTPGLAAPQAPQTLPRSTQDRIIRPAPTYGRTVPGPEPGAGSGYPDLPSTTGPQAGGGSVDPADRPPVLPPDNASMQFRGMRPGVPRSQQGIVSSPNRTPVQNVNSEPETRSSSNPFMTPIPAPKNFEMPKKWNPGLLRESDMTAMRPVPAGESKRIHWASFEEQQSASPQASTGSSGLRPVVRHDEELEQRRKAQLQQQWEEQRKWQREVAAQPEQRQEMRVQQRPVVSSPERPSRAPARRYDTSGWQSTR